MELYELGAAAKAASRTLAVCGVNKKNFALKAISEELLRNKEAILQANATDIAVAKENGIADTMIDRLMLTEARIEAIANAVLKVVALPDPTGEVEDGFVRPNGLMIRKVRVPIGVVGMIYESRPNVTVDAAVLCLKSGNSIILRGGKEAYNTNVALVGIMQDALVMSGLPRDCISMLEDLSRETAAEFMRMNEYLDVLIPRGGAGLISAVVKNATVPVIETGVGNCHVYVDEFADVDKALNIIENAKIQRPSVCNAAETLLVNKDIAESFLPECLERLSVFGVSIHGCEETAKLAGQVRVVPATEEDYKNEYLDLAIAVKVVDDIDDAIDHITRYSTGHSECIITENITNADRFTKAIDAAAVYVNASTRFTDGEEFGFGAEIGISTQKLHARGPMGLKELTTTKYIIIGNGQIR